MSDSENENEHDDDGYVVNAPAADGVPDDAAPIQIYDLVELRLLITDLGRELCDLYRLNDLLAALEKTRRQLTQLSLAEERVIQSVDRSYMSMTPIIKNIVNVSSNIKANERFIREGVIRYKEKRGFDEYDKDHVLLNGLENISVFFRQLEYIFELKGGFIFRTICSPTDRLSLAEEDRLGQRHQVGDKHYGDKRPLVVCCNNQNMFIQEVTRLLKTKNTKKIMAGVCPSHHQELVKQPYLSIETSLLVGSFRYVVVGYDLLKDNTTPTVFL